MLHNEIKTLTQLITIFREMRICDVFLKSFIYFNTSMELICHTTCKVSENTTKPGTFSKYQSEDIFCLL